ncbi:MAG TPA: hypothetical protein VGL27_16390 [Negativicutes bacterium]
MMDITAFRIKTGKEEAAKLAQTQGGFLAKLLCAGKSLSEIRLHFIECKLITYEITYTPGWLEKIIFRKAAVKKQTITMLADGSNGSVSWVNSLPEVVTLQDVDESQVQYSIKNDNDVINKGMMLALKVVHRHVGGLPDIKMLKLEKVFRPYWVAFFGEVIIGNKVRYSPIAADGCGVHRTF